MKVFLQILAGVIIIPIFLVLMLSSFVKFRLLDYNFWSQAYSQTSFQESVDDKIDSFVDAIVTEQLSKGEMEKAKEEMFRQQVTSFTQGLDKELVVLILDTNTKKILDFVNGKAESLKVYLPAEKLGIDDSSGMFAQIKVGPDEYEVSKFLSHPSSDEGLSNLFGILTKIGTFSTALFAASFVLFVIFLSLFFLITKRLSSLGKLLIALGVIGFLLSVPVYLALHAPDPLAQTIEPSQAILFIFTPIIFSGLLTHMWIFSGGSLFLGISGVIGERFLKKGKKS